MIEHPAFEVAPWSVRETSLDLDVLAQTESVFALSNGHIGMRGNLDEGEPHAMPGTYLNSFHELRPLPYAEAGYGYPESGQTVVNVTNGKLIRLMVNDEPLDVRYGQLRSHQRVLDLRAGTLERNLQWMSPDRVGVRVRSTRLVSLVQRAVAAIAYEVEPLDASVRIVIQSELVANEAIPATTGDPRAAAALEAPLHSDEHHSAGTQAMLIHSTARSGLRLAVAMDHVLDIPEGSRAFCESEADLARLSVITRLQPGQRLRVVKFLAYGWSGQRSLPALRDQVVAALAAARHTGWDGLLADQRAYLDSFWDRADVELEGDDEVQQAVRFALFHVLQAGVRAEKRPIPAKGLTGPGYDGHAFWDTETMVLPVLTYTAPDAAADALRWRHSILGQARERAAQLGLEGAVFPWRTISGRECSGYWPAGTAAFHLQADIADAVLRYQRVSGDAGFEREAGLEVVVETARLWASVGHYDPDGRFRIDGVTGPDEYSAIADNNVYTNLMAAKNLRAAAEGARRHPDLAGRWDVTDDEIADWERAASAMAIPYDERLGVHPQAEDFTNHEVWDFAGTRPDQYPLLLHFPYFDLYRKQVVKQADLVLAMIFCGDAFTDEQKARNFEYYEALTVRDSSLSAAAQSVMAAEVGRLELAYDYLGEAALMDLEDVEHNTRDGLHMASLAGAWFALVAGFGGMRDHGGELSFNPRLPPALQSLRFNVNWRGQHLRVAIGADKAEYTLVRGRQVRLVHHGTEVTLTPDELVAAAIPALPRRRTPVHQPPGREPARRTPGAGTAAPTGAGSDR